MIGNGMENELGRRNKMNECVWETLDSDRDLELC